jgi:hypothetical protein
MTQPPDRCDLLRDLRTAREHLADALYAAGFVARLDVAIVEALSQAEALLSACEVLAQLTEDRTVRRRKRA